MRWIRTWGGALWCHDEGLREKSRLLGTVWAERQQSVVEYLTVADLGHLTQKRTVDEIVHGGSLFWQQEEKGCRDLCGDSAPP